MWKELRISLFTAVVISGAVCIYTIFSQPGDYALTLTVTVSLFMIVIFSTVFGALVPLTLEKLKINPALATGPFIQITNDVVGLLIYVMTAMWMMRIFS